MFKEQKTIRIEGDDQSRNWFIFDATGKTLGRLSAEIAKILRGKHKPSFSPDTDLGDGVIVINAEKVHVSGNKEAQKEYIHHTGFMGGLRRIPYRVMQARKPEYIITHAVRGMVPRTKLGRKQMKRLRIFAGTEHNLEAQKPIQVNI